MLNKTNSKDSTKELNTLKKRNSSIFLSKSDSQNDQFNNNQITNTFSTIDSGVHISKDLYKNS